MNTDTGRHPSSIPGIGLAFALSVALMSEVQASESCDRGTPGAKDYCASWVCGPCAEGEGDCDPGQCVTGTECVEEGTIDHCRTDDTCSTPGAKDYCASWVCGPCDEGEGDCDPGQCATGLECVEEGDIDSCRADDTCGTPGAKDYCASWVCGPCDEGEGDCDPGQCETGLECVEEGDIDYCRTEDTCGTPGAKDYCASWVCGPCDEGEGDCDPGQCETGLECVEEGEIDSCRTDDDTCGTPGAWDYCSSSACGPCADGEGDCDPGQCNDGLGCVEEGSVDTCREVEAGFLQVWDDGEWRSVCCDGSRPELSAEACWWTLADRTLTDETSGSRLDCLEGDPANCVCNSVGETQHGTESLLDPGGAPLYPNYREETCVIVDWDGHLATDWADWSCPNFRLD